MLALERRQHMPYLNSNNTLPSPPPSQHLTFEELSQHLSNLTAQDLYNEKLNHYLQSTQQSFATPVIVDEDTVDFQGDSDQYMSSAFTFPNNNPAIRLQQSTPSPQLHTAFDQQPMLSAANATAASLNNWGSFATNGNAQLDSSQVLQTPVQSRVGRTHQRASSASSIGSNGSQYQPVNSTGFSYVAHSEQSPSPPVAKLVLSHGADEATRNYSHQQHLPTPSQTPTQEAFTNMNHNFNNFPPNSNAVDATMSAHYSMKQALMDQGQHLAEEDVPGFGHSARHSVSSFGHDSPATPHMAHEEYDDRFKVPPNDMRSTVPKFERTYTDAAVDELYNPAMIAAQIPHSAPQSSAPVNASLLSPMYGNSNSTIKNAMKAAQNARSQSPASAASRGVSPFRNNSPFAGNGFNTNVRVGTAAHVREQQKAEADAYALKNLPLKEEPQPKTISPKDALLDYNPEADGDSKGSLFPDSGASEYEHQYNSGDQYRNATQSSFDTTSTQNYRRDDWTTSQFSTNFSAPSIPSTTQAFNFAPPSVSGNLHGLGYSPQQYRAGRSNLMTTGTDPTPDFPAHLTSMESSASEADPSASEMQKPASSNADTGTYTCTYHGCTLRFDTPQRLQKHKREGHRNANTVGGNMTSAAALERNSQAGPHKCERINPTTGKPCNTIFSRPYDLTRHEDTIHNARKQKVRCALCVEDKTFSRNDALTRHMRVVHPDVDFPGKHRRRGGNHD
jgi:hypothetical protein